MKKHYLKTVALLLSVIMLAGCGSSGGNASSAAPASSKQEGSSSSASSQGALEIKRVTDPEFAAYGQVMQGYDVKNLLTALDDKTPLPDGVEYVTSVPALEETDAMPVFKNNVYGGMPIQIGYCNGHNTKLNCLEYHRDSEINIGTKDFILLVARRDDIKDGKVDTSKVKAFLAKAGEVVEIYATTLHYAPCDGNTGDGFKVIVVLPKGTNESMPSFTPKNDEDKWMTACNKWLLAHSESDEAKNGAYVGLTGENIDISKR